MGNTLLGSSLSFALTVPSMALAISACHHSHHVSPTAPAWLDKKAEDQAKALSQGERVGEVLHGASYGDDDRKRDFNVMLDATRCYWFSGVGDDGVIKMSLYLWDPKDHRVTDRRSSTSEAVINFCPEETGMYRVQGKVGDGYGHFAIAVYGAVAPAKPPPPPAPTKPQPLGLEAMIEKQAASAAPGATRVGNFFDGNGDQTDWYTSLALGSCYWFVGAGEIGKVKKLSMYLWDPQNKRVTENRAETNGAMVGHCPKQPGMFKFQAKVESGSGAYKVGVFEKKN